MDQKAILVETNRIAQQAGVILRTKFAEPLKQMTKASAVDIVTEADQAAEVFIVGELTRLYPEHHIVGEEGGGQGAPIESAEYHWYIDPIDGTTNFANGIPHFCVSMALTDTDRQPLVAVIYDPVLDELFSATRGGGVTLNGNPIRVSEKTTLIESVIASGFPYTKNTSEDNNTVQWAAMTREVRGIRRLGSAALEFAYVAAGRLDGYWEGWLNSWDALAGVLLVQEAGGTVTDFQGGNRPQWDEHGRFLTSNGHIHQQMLDVLNQSTE